MNEKTKNALSIFGFLKKTMKEINKDINPKKVASQFVYGFRKFIDSENVIFFSNFGPVFWFLSNSILYISFYFYFITNPIVQHGGVLEKQFYIFLAGITTVIIVTEWFPAGRNEKSLVIRMASYGLSSIITFLLLCIVLSSVINL